MNLLRPLNALEEKISGMAWYRALDRKFGGYASPIDLIVGGLVILYVATLPIRTGGVSGTFQNVLMMVSIYAILALGLNIVVGFTGLLDLGYVTFFATGAVVTAFLTTLTRTADGIDWPIGKTAPVVGDAVLGFDGSYLLILVVAGLVCAVVGVLRGIPTLRVTGDYYAIVTLGFAEMVYEVFIWSENNIINFTRFTGGTFGIKVSEEYRPTLFGDTLYWNTYAFYYLVLACVVFAVIVCHHLNRSRVGRALSSIRLDETAARSCGVDVTKYKLLAFAVSGFLGGLGGGLFAMWTGTVAVKNLDVWQSVLILCCIVLGGIGSIRGVLLGSVVLMSLGEFLREDLGELLGNNDLLGYSFPEESRFLIYGIILIVFMRFRPQGILPPRRRGRPLDDSERLAKLTQPSDLYGLSSDAARRKGDA